MKPTENYGLSQSLIDAVKKTVEEAKKPLVGNQKKLDVDKDGDIEADDLKDLRSGKAKKEVIDVNPKMESVDQVEESIEDKLAMAKLMAFSRGKLTSGKSTAKKDADDKSKARFVSGNQYGGSRQADNSDDEEDKPKKTMKGVAKGVFKRRFNTKTFKNKIAKEEVESVEERTLTEPEMKKREEVVKGMKKNLDGFKERYGSRGKEVMYATATKIAKDDK